MIRIGLIALLTTALAIGSWMLRKEALLNAELEHQNRELLDQVAQAAVINHALAGRIKALAEDAARQQAIIMDSERQKTIIAQENARLRDEIDKGIKESPEWSAQPVPPRIAAGVRAALAGLHTNATSAADH